MAAQSMVLGQVQYSLIMLIAVDWNLLCSTVHTLVWGFATVNIMKMQVSGAQVTYTGRTMHMAAKHATYSYKLMKIFHSLTFFGPMTQSVTMVMCATLEM